MKGNALSSFISISRVGLSVAVLALGLWLAAAGTAAAQEASISVSITPASGPCGTVVEVTGTGFPPGADMLVLAGERGQDDEPATTADSAGMFSASLNVTGDACASPAGARILACAFVASACQETVTLRFEFTEEETPTTTASTSFSISPASGPCGTVVDVSGEGYPPGAGVQAAAIPAGGRHAGDTPTATANAAGAFSATLDIPESECPSPTGMVVVVRALPDGQPSAAIPFAVSEAELPTTGTSGPPYSESYVHLYAAVALGLSGIVLLGGAFGLRRRREESDG